MISSDKVLYCHISRLKDVIRSSLYTLKWIMGELCLADQILSLISYGLTSRFFSSKNYLLIGKESWHTLGTVV